MRSLEMRQILLVKEQIENHLKKVMLDILFYQIKKAFPCEGMSLTLNSKFASNLCAVARLIELKITTPGVHRRNDVTPETDIKQLCCLYCKQSRSFYTGKFTSSNGKTRAYRYL